MSAVRPPFDVALPAITDEILEAYGGGFTFIEQNERDWTQEAVDFAAEIVRPAVQRRIRELEAENARLNMEMAAYRQGCTKEDAAAMQAVMRALEDEKIARAADAGGKHG